MNPLNLEQEIEYIWLKIEACSRMGPQSTARIRAYLNLLYKAQAKLR